MSLHTYMTCLVIGSLIAFQSNTWFGAWVGLEMNLLSFIPIMINLSMSQMVSSSAVKYFLIQAMGSSLVIFFALLQGSMESFATIYSLSPYLLSAGLLLKLGAAPFHFWFPAVMTALDWWAVAILSTWQKLAPLALINAFIPTQLVLAIGGLSALVGSVVALTQTSLRKIMAYSSISNLGWILTISIVGGVWTWGYYFMIYSYLVILIAGLLNNLQLTTITELFTIPNPSMLLNLFMQFFSLAGLPPLWGFAIKWLGIQVALDQTALLACLFMASFASIYFYVRLSFIVLTGYIASLGWNYPKLTPSQIFLHFASIPSFVGLVIS